MNNTSRNWIIIVIIAIIIIIGLWWYFSMPLAGENENATSTGATSTAGITLGGAQMLPSDNLVVNAEKADNLTTLVGVLNAAGLSDVLQSQSASPFTVFAPTNAAFDKLPDGTVQNLLKPENKDQLTDLLEYHVVAGAYTTSDFQNGMRLKTLNGDYLTLTQDADGNWVINGIAKIQSPDIVNSNGILFTIDTVLTPTGVGTTTATTTTPSSTGM